MIGKLEQLQAIAHKIDTDKRFLVSVTDNSTNTVLYKLEPAGNILNEFGNGLNFFEHLNASGHTNITIAQYRKNGTGRLRDGDPITVSFLNQSQNQEEQKTETSTVAVAPVIYQQPKPSRNDADILGSFGLNAPALMELYVEKNEANRLRTDNAELKADNKRLKEENEKYRESILSDKYNFEKESAKRSNTNDIIGKLSGALPLIMQHLKPQSSTGLSGPVDYGSEVKNKFSEILKVADDETIKVLSVIVEALGTNIEFSNQLIEILKNHNLWQ